MKGEGSALITGGAGFIGSHMADELLSNGWKVTALDNLVTGSTDNIDHLRSVSGFSFVEGDLLDKSLVKRLLAGKDAVFHFAAMVSVPLSIERPEECHRNNVTAFSDLIIAMRESGIPLIYASSAAVYGNREDGKRHEGEMPLPVSPYGASKAINEIQAGSAARIWGMDCVGFRFFNVFGPRQDPFGAYASVIPKFCTAIARGETPAICGDGTQTRDFVYVKDLTSVLLRMYNVAGPNRGKIFNVATGSSISVNELLRLISDIMGVPAEAKLLPERAGDVKYSSADISGLSSVLGGLRLTDIGTALSETAKWYKTNSQRGGEKAL